MKSARRLDGRDRARRGRPLTDVVPGAGLSGTIVDATRSGYPILVCIHGGCFDHSYFDFPGASFLAAAESMGIGVIAVDRPGYGTSPRPEGSFDFVAQAARLDDAIATIWAQLDGAGDEAGGVVLIGHSIGSAVAIALAARQPTSWPLRGLFVSGIHEQTPAGSLEAYQDVEDGSTVELSDGDARHLMLGPEGTYDEAASARLPEILRPLWIDDFREVTRRWPQEIRELAPGVRCPVRIAVAEFDPLITPTVDALDRTASLFESAPVVEQTYVKSSGHCIDFHIGGRAFQLEEIAFALGAAIPPPRLQGRVRR